MANRVVCGLSDTIETLVPTSAFTSVDLPTFGLPTTATTPERRPRGPRSVGSLGSLRSPTIVKYLYYSRGRRAQRLRAERIGQELSQRPAAPSSGGRLRNHRQGRRAVELPQELPALPARAG